MFALAYTCNIIYSNATENKSGNGVGNTIGLEKLNSLCKSKVYIGEVKFAVSLDCLNHIRLGKIAYSILIDKSSEGIKLTTCNRKTGGKLMTSELNKVIGAMTESINKIHSLDASSGSLTNVIRRRSITVVTFKGNENCGSGILLCYSRGYDTNYAVVPVVCIKNDNGIFLYIILLYLRIGLLHNLILFSLSFLVGAAKLFGNFHCTGSVIGKEELNSKRCSLNTACSIDTRRKSITDISGYNLCLLLSLHRALCIISRRSCFYKCGKTNTVCLLNH